MNTEKYLTELLTNYKVKNSNFDGKIYAEILKQIKQFDKKNISQIFLTGSTEKKTSSKPQATIELLVSLKAKDKRNPEEISKTYEKYFLSLGFKVKIRQFALCFAYKNYMFEIIPAKLKTGTYNYHRLYDPASKKETITNINILNSDVVNSKNQDEIILMKLWRDKHLLQFPSIYLELVVMKALRTYKKKNLFSRLLAVFNYLSKDFTSDTYYDPSNSDNIVSDILSMQEKEQIKSCADTSLLTEDIKSIIS